MVILTISVNARSSKRSELLSACRLISDRTRQEKSCLDCRLSQDIDNENLVYADKYILGCLVIVFFTLLVGISNSILSARGNKVQAKRIDKISRWAAPASFPMLTGFAAVA